MFGIKLSVQKRRPMQPMAGFLGRLFDMTRAHEHFLIMQAKPATVRKALHMITEARTTSSLSPQEASKLRGILQWLDGALEGRPIRGAMTVLSRRQYHDGTTDLTPQLRRCLHYIHTVITRMPARIIHLGVRRPVIVVYTDCSEEGGKQRIGAYVKRAGQPAQVGSWDVPAAVKIFWNERKTRLLAVNS